VLILANHILDKLRAKVQLDESARLALLKYNFPGNVRELENMLERAVTLCTRGQISANDLAIRPGVPKGDGPAPLGSGNLGEQVEDVQRQAIIEALEKSRYNKTAAAKLLGVTFRQLRYRIKKLEIDA
jgi:two-component system response regulator PilR (NtrC family)